MIDTSIEVLKKIEEHSFKAYIVGGFVRDYILNISSIDVDNKSSMESEDIFKRLGVNMPMNKNGVHYNSSVKIDRNETKKKSFWFMLHILSFNLITIVDSVWFNMTIF